MKNKRHRFLSIGILLFCFLSFISSNVVASNLSDGDKVTLNLKNVTIKTFLEEIQKQTNLNFVYNADHAKSLKLITVKAKDESVISVLNRALAGSGFTYKIEGNMIMIRYQAGKVRSKSRNQKLSLTIKVTDETGREPLTMAVCSIKSLGIFAVTDNNGITELKGVPDNEEVNLEISYLGYESYKQALSLMKDVQLNIKMKQTSLQLKEVSVVAKNSAAGVSTSSSIGRQAIDHLQAVSLADIMQLVPGNLMTNTDLTSKSNLQIRTLTNNTTNAFGSTVIVDGVPVSSNANMGAQGSYSQTEFSGTDLRQISADNIESVEVIRGIPSAEYGDLTSGAVIVKTKTGYTPWQIKGKVNPSTNNFSLGKGFKLKNNWGTLNTNADYAQAWGDPRTKTKSFDRYSASVNYTKDFFKIWRTSTSVNYSGLIDWSGNDPDQINDGTFTKEKSAKISINHNGKIGINKLLSRTLSYTLGLSYSQGENRRNTIVSNSTGFLPILTATETGYHQVPFETSSYKAAGGSKSYPKSFYFKLSNSFYYNLKSLYQRFNMGVEYKNESNSGIGYYNDNDRYPLQPNNNGRPRSYSDIPALNQVSGYLEDNIRWKFGKRTFKLQLGGRFTSLQPGKEEQTFSFSPRINTSVNISSWLEMRGGFGINSKTPGLIHLYPDKKYTDRISVNYLPVGKPAEQLVMYHTMVYDTQRTKGLKNANNTKYELGFDIKLPKNRKLSIIAYHDKTGNGFGPLTEYYTYTSNVYTKDKGLITSPGQATTVAWNNPARIDTVFSTTGKIGNTNVSINKGIEMDLDLGEIPAIRSAFYLTGAYMQTEGYTNGLNTSDPSNLPSKYSISNTTPFKIVYPSGSSKDINRRFSTNLRMVCNIPSLRMVASLATQVIWYTYSATTNQKMDPIGWIDTDDLSYHKITASMLNDPNYTIKEVLLSKQRRNPKNNPAASEPVLWMMSGRLTKELGKNSGFSFYANNLFYYEPFKSNNLTTTLSQRNEGTFNFGVELFFNF